MAAGMLIADAGAYQWHCGASLPQGWCAVLTAGHVPLFVTNWNLLQERRRPPRSSPLLLEVCYNIVNNVCEVQEKAFRPQLQGIHFTGSTCVSSLALKLPAGESTDGFGVGVNCVSSGAGLVCCVYHMLHCICECNHTAFLKLPG